MALVPPLTQTLLGYSVLQAGIILFGIASVLAAHGVEQERKVFDVAGHRPLDAEIAVDRRRHRLGVVDARRLGERQAERAGGLGDRRRRELAPPPATEVTTPYEQQWAWSVLGFVLGPGGNWY